MKCGDTACFCNDDRINVWWPHGENWMAFLRSRLGHSWVIARRTQRLANRYPADTTFITKRRFAALQQEYMKAH